MVQKGGLEDTQPIVSNVLDKQHYGLLQAIQETFEQLGLWSEASPLEVRIPIAECSMGFLQSADPSGSLYF